MTPITLRTFASLMVAVIAILVGSPDARAAWPDSYEGRVANLDALRWDLGYPGVGDNAAYVKKLYARACDLKSSNGCNASSWQGDLDKAAAYFRAKCPKDPQACVVMGWSKSRDNWGNLSAASMDPKGGYGYFKKACDKAYAAGCTGMGEMHMAGIGAKQDWRAARKYVAEGCAAKDYYGCYLLGNLYEKGRGVG
ncbi:MAG: hypothetical protein VX265_18310, partial [Myxococcota bacterium]|nr:hypothetical protein [Myxococcota bacterium]